MLLIIIEWTLAQTEMKRSWHLPSLLTAAELTYGFVTIAANPFITLSCIFVSSQRLLGFSLPRFFILFYFILF